MSALAPLPLRLWNSARIWVQLPRERRLPFWPAERIVALQAQRVRRMVAWAYRTVPYYRRTLDELGLKPSDFQSAGDLARLPILEGWQVRQNLDDFTSRAIPPTRRIEQCSSGTTSTALRKRIYWDEAAHLAKMAMAERDRPVLAGLLGQQWGLRQLYILVDESTSWALRRWWNAHVWQPRALAQRQQISSLLPPEELIAHINAVRPDVIFSYGSTIELVLRYAEAHGLEVATPRVWMYGGDMLGPQARAWAEQRHHLRIYSSYQSVEAGRIGFECERGQGYHLNCDLVAVRVVDEALRPVPAGQVGEIVISNLVNRATVLLNYRLGDWGRLAAEPCPCGRGLPLLQSLEGRRDYILQGKDGRNISFYDLEDRAYDLLCQVIQSQVAHPAPGEMVWRIVAPPALDRITLARALVERTAAIVGDALAAQVEFVEAIPLTRYGKHLPLVRSPGAPESQP